ncbi:MAG: lipopolysaccharide heptosyltransferase II [Bacteroidota bacterium]|nr:lipopolysaccharide heptosyltransferase II [Bacteroidota bacterium]
MPSTLRKILLIRLSSIGDIILTTPMLRVLKARYPEVQLHFAVRREFSDLLRRNPHIDRLIAVDTAQGTQALRALNLKLTGEQYDAVFDLQNNFRSRLLRNGLSRSMQAIDKRQWRRLLLLKTGINLYRDIDPVPDRYIETAARYGLAHDHRGPELHLDVDLRGNARLKLRAAGWRDHRPLIGLCPGARHYSKRWPAARFAALASLLLARGCDIAVFGAEDERETADALQRLHPERVHNCCGRLSLMENAAAMEHCAVVFANDSGLMHMATAVGVPVVAVFGSTVREFGFAPYQSPSAVVEIAGLSCRPCTHIGRARCPKKHLGCLRLIREHDVIEAWDALSSALSPTLPPLSNDANGAAPQQDT